MDPLWIIAAFVFGVIVARLGLPPLVGYLVAGFVLNSFGVEGGQEKVGLFQSQQDLLAL